MGIDHKDHLTGAAKDAVRQTIDSAVDAVMPDAAGDFLWDGLNSIVRFFKDRPVTLQTFLSHTGDVADDMMENALKKERLICYGGTLTMSMAKGNAQNVRCVMRLYFQDSKGSWQLKEGETSFPIARFWDWDQAPEFARIRQGQTVEFPIDPPQEKE